MATEGDHAEDCVESVEEEETGDAISNRILNFPEVLAALQKPPNIFDYIASLPMSIKRRVRALKRLQEEQLAVEAQFFEEVHKIECKYHKLYTPMYLKRMDIINGKYEPTDEECFWRLDDDEDDISKELHEKAKVDERVTEKVEPDLKKEEEQESTKGIPDFWLTVFKNVSTLSEMVQEHDEPIIKHLTDITTEFHEDPMGFTLTFHFSPNEYFTNTTLTKEYSMKCVPERDDPFGFEGPEIYSCKGCTINWNKGKNVTVKTVKKKQKHKSRGMMRTVTCVVQNDSFFNFFSPPAIPEDIHAENVDDETRTLLTTDFEIGHFIRERVVPRAVLFFTGEGIDDFEEEEEEDDEEDDDDEESDDAADNTKAAVAKDQNCKQQ